MGYIGENSDFSFRDGFCEPLAGKAVSTSGMANFGKSISGLFSRFSLSCDNEKNVHLMYALCSGIAECGKDVYLSKNTDLPSFRHSLHITGSDCGIYISGSAPKLSFFGGNGISFCDEELQKIICAKTALKKQNCGQIIPMNSLKNLYIGSISDKIEWSGNPISAGISCGNRTIRNLWNEFFTGEDDTLVFQVSDDGSRTNAYITDSGFVSYEKLVTASILSHFPNGGTVWLPDSFHYAAEDMLMQNNITVNHYNPNHKVPTEANGQRFINDTLFMCVNLASERDDFFDTLKKLPDFASAKREVILNLSTSFPFSKTFFEQNGRLHISKSGRERVTLTAQAYTSETAAELCGLWSEKLKKLSSCNNLFHSDSEIY